MGRPKKIVKEVEVEVKKPGTVVEAKVSEPKPVVKEKPDEAKETKKERVLEPLQPGQKYFEAPDGTIIVGESDKQQVWYRQGDGGRGCYINPKR